MAGRRFTDRLLESWGKWSIKHWGKALLMVLGITLVMLYGAAHVRTEMTYYSILPAKEKNVKDLKVITENFPMASAVIAVIDGRNIEDQAEAERKVKAVIDELQEKFKKEPYSRYITRTAGRTDTSLFREHGLMLLKSEDIHRFSKIYSDLSFTGLLRNINNDFESVYSGNGDKLSEDEELALSQFSGLEDLLRLMSQAASGKKVTQQQADAVIDKYLFGNPYLLSNDNRMGLFIIEPNFTMNNIDLLAPGVNTLEKGVKETAAEYGVKAGLTGLTTVGRDEMETSEKGLAVSSTTALVLILLLMIFAFRMFSAPLVSGIPLITGIIWTIGWTGFIIHRLNIVTAMYMIVLLGLGIDYAIHLLTAYTQEKEEGAAFNQAVLHALSKSGNGIIIGALTTAAAFFMLSFSKTEMVSELGIVAGFGILSELAAMIMLIPPLLSYRHHRLEKKGKVDHPLFAKVKINAHAVSGLGSFLVKNPLSIALVMTLVIGGFSLFATKVAIEQNIMNMEAKGLESIKLQDEMSDEFGMAPDGLSILSSSIPETKDLDSRLKKLSSVKRVESIAPYVTTEEEAKERTPAIVDFIQQLSIAGMNSSRVNPELLLDEVYRLEDNFLELSDLAWLGNMKKMAGVLSNATGRNLEGEKTTVSVFDTLGGILEAGRTDTGNLGELQKMIQKSLSEKLKEMSSIEPVTVSMVPPAIRDSYVSTDGNTFLVNIVPTKNPWNEEFRDIYKTQVASVTDKATGMILASDVLNTMAREDGVRSSIGAVIVIFLIILLDFKNLKLALFTMIPLAGSFLVLFGVMGIFSIKFDFVNIIAVPLLIGIGIDDAVHINHRYLLEGKGSMDRVIGKTGTALFLTSLTTIIGFASFIPSPMRAMKSTGIVLSLAMAIAFINSVLLHPAVLVLAVEKLKLSINPWRKK